MNKAFRKIIAVISCSGVLLCAIVAILFVIPVSAEETVEFLPKNTVYTVEGTDRYDVEIEDPLQNPQIAVENFKLSLRGRYTFLYKDRSSGAEVKKIYVCVYEETDDVEFDSSTLIRSFGYKQLVNVQLPLARFMGYEKRVPVSIVSPSGKRVLFEKSATYSVLEMGEYTVEYEAVFGSKKKNCKDTIVSEVSAASVFHSDKNVSSVVPNVELPAFSEKGNGVEILMMPGGQFSYANKIDLNQLGKEDDLLRLQIHNRENFGVISSMYVTLTDAHDENNSVYYYFRATDNGEHAYVLFGYDGKEVGRSNESHDYGQVREYWGSVAWNRTFYGNGRNGRGTFAVSADYSKKQFYIDAGGPWMILDADDPEQTGAGKEWKGFTTGEVYLSVRFGFENALTGGVVVTKVAGRSVSGAAIQPSEYPAPVITPETDSDYLTEMPKAAVGVKYPIPSARALDWLFGDVDVSVCVLKDGRKVSENEAFFVPTVAGEYVLVYEASNELGVVSEKRLSVVAERGLSPILIALDEKPSAPEILKSFRLPSFVYSGGSGKVIGREEIRLNGRKIDPDPSRQIFIEEAGILTVTAIARGYCGEETRRTYSFVIASEADVVIGYVPEAYVSGKKAALPAFRIANPSDPSRKYEMRCYVNGEMSEKDYFIPEKGTKSVSIRFEGICGEEKVERTVTVPIIEPSGIAEYFLVERGNATLEADRRGTQISTSENGTTVVLANAVAAEDLQVRFYIESQKSEFGYLDVHFSDCVNKNIGMFLRVFPRNESTSFLQVNGIGEKFIADGSFRSGEVMFSLGFDFRHGILNDSRGIRICSIPVLPEAAAKIRFIFGEVEGESAIVVNQISNHIFNKNTNMNGDRKPPVIVLGEELGERLNVDYGSFVTVPAAKAYDVLDPFVRLRVYVTDPFGDVVFEGNGGKEGSFEVTKYGTYEICYEAADASEQSAGVKIPCRVIDATQPVMTVSHKMREVYRLGDKLYVPTAKAVDALEGDCETFVYVIDSATNSRRLLEQGTDYRLTASGRFEIVVYTTDSHYNVVRKSYPFTVTA